MTKTKLLIVEDDEAVRTQMKWVLSGEYTLFFASDADSAISTLRAERMPLVTLDLALAPSLRPDRTDGLQIISGMLEIDPNVKVIVVTGNNDKDTALKAVSMGAHDYFVKPVEAGELLTILKRANYVYSLESEYRKLKETRDRLPFEEMIGASESMQDVFSTVRKVATTCVPVLIMGESGTGKELVAKAIHSSGIRKDKPFIPINCGAIPDNLLESELFGHEKGAFTGAHAQRCGRIELAHGGTLFLDEIGDLPLALQVKLLRFLQDHRIDRLGGRESLAIDVRVVAATNKDLKALIADGRFREDLYYRLAVVTIDLPPLRDRGEDIKLLARAFMNKFTPETAEPKTLSQESLDALASYNWPGNIRELENRIRRAITFAEGRIIRPDDLAFGRFEGCTLLDFKKAKEDLELRYVSMAILKHNGNISRAAEELGLSRPTVHSIIKRHHLKA